MELREFLTWLVTAAGVIAFALIEYAPKLLPAWFGWLLKIHPMLKRAIACALSALIAIGGFLGQVRMGYEMLPTGQAAFEKLFLIGTSAFGLATLVHGFTLRRKPEPAPADLPTKTLVPGNE